MSNSLPNSWKVIALDEVCSWVGVGIATSTTHAYTNKGVPLLRNQNILPNSIRKSDVLLITEEFSEQNKSKKIREGDIVTIRTGYPGVSAVVPAEFDGCHSFTTLISRPIEALINSHYLSTLINSDYGRDFVLGAQAGGAQQNLNSTALKTFPVILPPLPEQQKIATILTSVNEVIEKTQAQIDKLKDLKTGMMQELLTKGIGHTEFKDSPVGRIPVGWEVCTVESVMAKIIDYRGKAPPKSESGVPLITAKNIRKGYINEEPKEYIFEDQYDSWMVRGMPKVGDVFITTEAPLGNVAKVPSYKFAIGQRVLTLRPKESIICTDFLLFVMQSEVFRKELELQSTGSTVAGIKQSTFRKVLLPVPSICEQKEIAKHISSIISCTSTYDMKLTRFKDMKKALMQDLLTGKVRVNTEQTSTEVAVG